MLAGEVDVILPDMAAAQAANDRRRLAAGQFVYYPSNFAHTLETVSTEPANYLMFKWQTDASEPGEPLGFGQFDAIDRSETSRRRGLPPAADLHRADPASPQAGMPRLHHDARRGYEPHVDAYDVAIIVLEGEVETLGQRAAAHSVIFYPAGSSHGMRNPGQSLARYIVLEFHGSRSAMPSAPSTSGVAAHQASRSQRWRRKLRHLYRRLRGDE